MLSGKVPSPRSSFLAIWSTAQMFSNDPAAQPAMAAWSTLIFPFTSLDFKSRWMSGLFSNTFLASSSASPR